MPQFINLLLRFSREPQLIELSFLLNASFFSFLFLLCNSRKKERDQAQEGAGVKTGQELLQGKVLRQKVSCCTQEFLIICSCNMFISEENWLSLLKIN
jgi:hypothetical protein